MITTLFRRASRTARLTQSPRAGNSTRALVLTMQKQGYASATIMNCVLCAEKFFQWLSEERLPLTDVDETLVPRYTEQLAAPHSRGMPQGYPAQTRWWTVSPGKSTA